MKVAITGGTGFVGKRLAVRHHEAGDSVRVLSRKKSAEITLPDGIHIHRGDLASSSPEVVVPFVEGVDVLYHCAGETNDPRKMVDLHVGGTRKLCGSAAGRIRHWVQLSSTGVYGRHPAQTVSESSEHRPTGVYEETKNEAENLVMAAAAGGSFTCSIVQPTIIFGEDMPNDSLRALIRAVEKGWFCFVGNPAEAKANYIYVENVVDAMMLCADKKEAENQTYIVSDQLSVRDFVRQITRLLGMAEVERVLPRGLMLLVASAGQVFPGFPLTRSRVDALSSRTAYSAEKIGAELGFRNGVSIAEGLKRIVAEEPFRDCRGKYPDGK